MLKYLTFTNLGQTSKMVYHDLDSSFRQVYFIIKQINMVVTKISLTKLSRREAINFLNKFFFGGGRLKSLGPEG